MLQQELTQGYDVVRIARRTYGLHADARTFEPGLEQVLLKLVAMEEGPEYEIPEVELRELAESLCR
jgi:hypothetical protein